MNMTLEQRRSRLKDWLDLIEKNVTEAVTNQHIFWEVQDIIRDNPHLQNTSSAFYQWMGSTFVHSSALAVRRQVDGNPKSVSLLRFLLEVQKYPDLISRDYGNTVQQEIDSLQAASKTIHHYADRTVAHYHTRGFPGPVPKFADLEDCLKFLEKLVLRYLLLLKGASQSTLLPTFMYDWKDVFRIPWIP